MSRLRTPSRLSATSPVAFTVLAAFTAFAALSGAALAAGDRGYAVPKDDRPAWLGPSPARLPLDCAGAPVVGVAAGTDTTLTGDTTGVLDLNAGYACVAWNESGGEAVFLLQVAQDVSLTAALSGMTADLDLFLLSACDGDACLAAGNTEFALQVAPGDYVLVVDGYAGAAGPFQLALRARAAGVPLSVCEGGASAQLCAQDPLELDGTLWSAPNLIESYPCSPYIEQAGEAWYAVTMADSSQTTVILSQQIFDGALWLFAGCGPDAVCLGFADDGAAGATETLTFSYEGGGQATVYLAVDATRAPAEAAAATFHLSIDCSKPAIVPVSSASWGALKTLYR